MEVSIGSINKEWVGVDVAGPPVNSTNKTVLNTSFTTPVSNVKRVYVFWTEAARWSNRLLAAEGVN